jgi:hypothetical protein
MCISVGAATIAASHRLATERAAVALASTDSASAAAPVAYPAPGPELAPRCAAYPAARVVRVATGSQLSAALAGARPGDRIELADGRYAGHFAASTSGTKGRRIALCGTRRAVLDAGTLTSDDAFTLRGSYWTLAGFTVTNARRGVYLEHASHNVLTGLLIHGTGQEAVHFRAFSRHNTIEKSAIHDTGLRTAEYGEGVYIGTYNGQWCTYTGCAPDRSDSNRVLKNVIGPDVRAEAVDVKEGTTGGVIRGNTFDGHGMVMSRPWVDSWVELKGNHYLVAGNRGVSSPRDGFQTFRQIPGWGNDNVFTGNTADVQGPGYGIRVTGVTGTVVRCDNVVTNAGAGPANLRCR